MVWKTSPSKYDLRMFSRLLEDNVLILVGAKGFEASRSEVKKILESDLALI